jgi:hypothetical protein
MNLDPIVPEARPVVEKAAAIYIHHTRQDFVGLIVHGSALKGGFIAGCSDVDLQLYVMPSALDAAGHLPFELTVAIHRDLARIDPAPFRYIQCYAFSTRMRDGWVGPVPGAYHVVAGRLPIPEATGEQLGQGARASLAALNPVPSYLTDGLLDHGGGRLEARVRLLCTEVWPALYHVLIVRGMDALEAWRLTKQQAIAALPADTDMGAAIRTFYDTLLRYYPDEAPADAGLDVLVRGVGFLRAAKADAIGGATNG